VNDPWHDRTLALAGIFQAARLTQQLAREGRCDPAAFRASLQSILRIDAPDTMSVFGGIGGVAEGLEVLGERLGSGHAPLDYELARYVINLMQLERALAKQPDMLEAIRRGIEAAESQMKFFGNDEEPDGVHPRLVEKLAELYSQTLSTLSPRILVNGEHGYLANPLIAAKVRAALLAGIRAAVLWRQLGGQRWQLLFMRSRIIGAARFLRESIRAG
jgi:high frequency lysogenization protein